MKQSGKGGRHTGPYFTDRVRLDSFEQLETRQLGGSGLTISRARRDKPDVGLTLPNARRDVYLASVTLIGSEPYDTWCDNRHIRTALKSPGGLVIVDQRHAWVGDLRQAIDSVHVIVPQRSLNLIAEEARAPPVEELECPVQRPRLDETMIHLTRALLPALSRPREASTLFVDHVLRAMLVHLAQTYGGLRLLPEIARRGLAQWQERRAKELLLDDLREDLSLSDLAEACGMSVRHFSRAFKLTTGLSPHRWLVKRRVERAKELLQNTDETLSEIALTCGFADQSHFGRVFRAVVGSSPGAWRRQRRS